MIKEIKYNRSVIKFNTFLDGLKESTTSLYISYYHNGATLFYRTIAFNKFMTIYIGYIIEKKFRIWFR